MNLASDSEIRRAFAPERSLEGSARDAHVVMARLNGRKSLLVASRASSWLVVAAALMVVMATAPPVRAVVGDLASTFGSYFSDSDDSATAPGTPVTSVNHPPPWLTADGRSAQRLLAEKGGHSLYVVRQPSGAFGFALDDTVGVTDSRQGWERQFAQNAVVILGPAGQADSSGDIPLFGLSSAAIDAVEIVYASGASTAAKADDGGFIVMVDANRAPVRLRAFDSSGAMVQELDLQRLHLGGRG